MAQRATRKESNGGDSIRSPAPGRAADQPMAAAVASTATKSEAQTAPRTRRRLATAPLSLFSPFSPPFSSPAAAGCRDVPRSNDIQVSFQRSGGKYMDVGRGSGPGAPGDRVVG